MRNTLFFLSLAAGFAIAYVLSAGAVPIERSVCEVSPATTSPLTVVQYARRGQAGRARKMLSRIRNRPSSLS